MRDIGNSQVHTIELQALPVLQTKAGVGGCRSRPSKALPLGSRGPSDASGNDTDHVQVAGDGRRRRGSEDEHRVGPPHPREAADHLDTRLGHRRRGRERAERAGAYQPGIGLERVHCAVDLVVEAGADSRKDQAESEHERRRNDADCEPASTPLKISETDEPGHATCLDARSRGRRGRPGCAYL